MNSFYLKNHQLQHNTLHITVLPNLRKKFLICLLSISRIFQPKHGFRFILVTPYNRKLKPEIFHYLISFPLRATQGMSRLEALGHIVNICLVSMSIKETSPAISQKFKPTTVILQQ
jgi:hypothetical protein